MRRTRALDARQFRALLEHPAMRTVLLSDDEMSTITVENYNPNTITNNNTATPSGKPDMPAVADKHQNQFHPLLKSSSQSNCCGLTASTVASVATVPKRATVTDKHQDDRPPLSKSSRCEFFSAVPTVAAVTTTLAPAVPDNHQRQPLPISPSLSSWCKTKAPVAAVPIPILSVPTVATATSVSSILASNPSHASSTSDLKPPTSADPAY